MNVLRIVAITGVASVACLLLSGCDKSDTARPDENQTGSLSLITSSAVAQTAGKPDKDSYVQPTLLADTTAVKLGTTFTLGVLYKVQPHWHIYYKSPGASGFATTVKWGVPQGASVGETQYPAPVTFESPGPVISYGYENETLLMTEARVTKAPENGKVEITAKTRWLMCSDRCIPNNKDLTLTLPVGEGEPVNQEIFAKYHKKMPKAGSLPKEAVLKATPSGSTMKYELTITPPAGKKLAAGGDDVHPPYFYPVDQKDYVIEPPEVTGKTADAGGVKVYDGPAVVTWTAEPGVNSAEPLKQLEGTLVYQTVTGSAADAPVLLEINQKI